MENINYTVHNYEVKNKSRIVKNYFSEEEQKFIDEYGYLKLNYKLDDITIKRLIEYSDKLLDLRYNKKEDTYTSKRFAGQYIRQPHYLCNEFLDIVSAKFPYVEMIRSLLGPRVLIRSYSLRVTHEKTNDGTMWHSDQRSFVTPIPILFTEPKVLTLTIYLDGATKDNGPLYVLPKSHTWDKQPTESEQFISFRAEKEFILEPGEAILFQSALWHKGGENKSNSKRRLLVIHFAPIFCKQAIYENVEKSKEYNAYIDKLYENEDEEMLELLGYNGLKKYPGFM